MVCLTGSYVFMLSFDPWSLAKPNVTVSFPHSMFSSTEPSVWTCSSSGGTSTGERGGPTQVFLSGELSWTIVISCFFEVISRPTYTWPDEETSTGLTCRCHILPSPTVFDIIEIHPLTYTIVERSQHFYWQVVKYTTLCLTLKVPLQESSHHLTFPPFSIPHPVRLLSDSESTQWCRTTEPGY